MSLRATPLVETPAIEFARGASAGEANRAPVFCHFTIAHTALKSRSFHRQCLPLAEAGFDVRFLSPAPIEGRHGQIEFVRLPRRATVLGRASGYAGLLRMLVRQGADFYHFQDPQLLPVALLLKQLFRKCVLYDAYEDFPSMAAHKQRLPRLTRPLAKEAVALAESVAARCVDAVVTADPLTMRRFAREKGSRKLVFYNFPHLAFFPPPREGEKPFDVVYRGGLSQRTGTFLLLDALSRLAREGRAVRLLLVGYSDPAGEGMLQDRIASSGLGASVELRGRIPHEEMAATLAEARIGVCPLQDVPKFRLNIPVKIFEYWACGLPVIASDLPPSQPFVRGSGAGLLIPPADAPSLARAIDFLLGHPAEAAAMGRCGRALVERRFHNSGEVRKLITLCARLAPGRRAACTEGFEHA